MDTNDTVDDVSFPSPTNSHMVSISEVPLTSVDEVVKSLPEFDFTSQPASQTEEKIYELADGQNIPQVEELTTDVTIIICSLPPTTLAGEDINSLDDEIFPTIPTIGQIL